MNVSYIPTRGTGRQIGLVTVAGEIVRGECAGFPIQQLWPGHGGLNYQTSNATSRKKKRGGCIESIHVLRAGDARTRPHCLTLIRFLGFSQF